MIYYDPREKIQMLKLAIAIILTSRISSWAVNGKKQVAQEEITDGQNIDLSVGSRPGYQF